MHGFLVCDVLADKSLAVDAHNLVAGKYAGTLRRTACYDVLYLYGVVVDGEFDAYAVEGAFQVVARRLCVLGCDVDGVWVQLCKNLRYGSLHQVVDIYGVDVLVINDVQQAVQLVGAQIDDVESVAGEMVGVEGADENTDDYAQCHNERHVSVVVLFHCSVKECYSSEGSGMYTVSMPARCSRSSPSVRRYCSP